MATLEREFEVSPMTARRDLTVLEEQGKVRRTHGGAVLPGVAGHEDSFQQRLEERAGAKKRLAKAAVKLVDSEEAVFLDSSTTAYYAARQILDEGLRATVLTNSLPVMELFTSNEALNVELVSMGGSLRKLTLSFVGPHTIRSIGSHFADKGFLSVKGLTPDGYLTDPDALEAEVKRNMIGRSEKPVLLVDGSKFEQRGLNTIAHVSELARVLAVDAPDEQLVALSEMGVEVRRV